MLLCHSHKNDMRRLLRHVRCMHADQDWQSIGIGATARQAGVEHYNQKSSSMIHLLESGNTSGDSPLSPLQKLVARIKPSSSSHHQLVANS